MDSCIFIVEEKVGYLFASGCWPIVSSYLLFVSQLYTLSGLKYMGTLATDVVGLKYAYLTTRINISRTILLEVIENMCGWDLKVELA